MIGYWQITDESHRLFSVPYIHTYDDGMAGIIGIASGYSLPRNWMILGVTRPCE